MQKHSSVFIDVDPQICKGQLKQFGPSAYFRVYLSVWNISGFCMFLSSVVTRFGGCLDDLNTIEPFAIFGCLIYFYISLFSGGIHQFTKINPTYWEHKISEATAKQGFFFFSYQYGHFYLGLPHV